MAVDKTNADHLERVETNPEAEALLAGAIALASLFSSCVEAFGLIHPSHKWDKEEQLLLTRLGLQQARLLIWGSVVGVASPPASVTDRAVPKHPSAAYPDLTEPTFFDARDPRLDDSDMRTTIEQTLSAIVDRSSHSTREEMMAKFGLKPPKRFGPMLEPAMDTNRLEAFREKFELLREVAESHHISTRRTNSIVHTSWMIADVTKFGAFIQLTQDKVDELIMICDVKEKVDRAMRMDIRVFGWHIMPDRTRTAMDISKLRLLQEICKADYPEYVVATQQALDNISRESREWAMSTAAINKQQAAFLSPESAENGTNGDHKKRPGLLKLFKSFGSHKKEHHTSHSRSFSGPSSTAEDADPPRAQSDAGHVLTRERSKSVGGGAIDVPPMLDENLRNRLEKMSTTSSGPDTATKTTPLVTAKAMDSPIEGVHQLPPIGTVERHDMYHGIARTATKDLHQANY